MTKRSLLTSVAAVSLFMLTGCADVYYKNLEQMPNSGSEYSHALANEYKSFVKREAHEFNDSFSTSVFAKKGEMAARGDGEMVQPEFVDAWIIPVESSRHELMQQREHLIKWLPCGQKKAPKEAAAAVRSFDEWVEQTMEGWQADDIANARQRFMDNLKVVEMKCSAHTVTTTVKHKKKHIPGLQPMLTTTVNFALDKSDLTADAKKALDAIEKNTDKEAYVTIDGYTDRCGSGEHNQALSKRRADSVEHYLLQHKNLERVESEGKGVYKNSKKIDPQYRRVELKVYNPNHKTKTVTKESTSVSISETKPEVR